MKKEKIIRSGFYLANLIVFLSIVLNNTLLLNMYSGYIINEIIFNISSILITSGFIFFMAVNILNSKKITKFKNIFSLNIFYIFIIGIAGINLLSLKAENVTLLVTSITIALSIGFASLMFFISFLKSIFDLKTK